ncbi:MAG: ORF6N domain-containing protein [Bacteroidales bacterium]|nr:ORF6N domain-containing protein [Bacteroidales bacterium]
MNIQIIQNKIYEIRGLKVILDRDLAEMYQTETKRLNEVVKRNKKRFPPDFMFELSIEELNNLKSQNATSSWGGNRKRPNAFTEQGVAMLSGLLNSEVAIAVNINIMRAFVALRKLVVRAPSEMQELQTEITNLKKYIEEVFADYNDINDDTRMQLELIQETLAELQNANKPFSKDLPQIGYTAERYKKR